MEYREGAVSWLLHSMKIILGDESIRRYIILEYNPKMKNTAKDVIRTFNAFVKKGDNREKKASRIVNYCNKMSQKKGTVVFTATNIQQHENDNETHFQSYILDNKNKRVIVIDPAYDKTKEGGEGIYMAEVSLKVVMPFFESKGYQVQFMDLSSPAQISDKDVFCQSWSLFILLEKLKNNEYLQDISFVIPENQLDKYDMILSFYKSIFTNLPALQDHLSIEYESEIIASKGRCAPTKKQKESILNINPYMLLMSMTKYDMKD